MGRKAEALAVASARPPLGRFGLRFADAGLEQAFRRDYDARIASQVRLSLFFGALLYLSLGWQDVWFFPESYPLVWLLRGTVAAGMIGMLLLVRHPVVYCYYPWLIAAGELVAGAGAIAMIGLGSAEVAASYYFGLTLVIVWGYTFSGLRLPWAATINIVLLAGYLAVSLAVDHTAPIWLATNGSNMLAASLLVGFTAYLIERQRRILFYQAMLLDAERRNQEHLALSDHLTGLPNRAYFERRIKEAVGRAQRHGHALAVIYIDIDEFKPINDSYGHQVGDSVLAVLARGLEQTLRANDTVARVGGDEFVALLEEVGGRAKAEKVADKLREAVRRPVTVRLPDGGSAIVQVSASIGVVMFPEDADTPHALLARADAAMYEDKLARRASRRSRAES